MANLATLIAPESIDTLLQRLTDGYPALLIDEIIYFEQDKSITAIKHIARNDSVFDEMVGSMNYPAVLVLEAIVQASTVIASYNSLGRLHTADQNIVSRLKNVQLHCPVLAGDQLTITVEVLLKKPYLWMMEAEAKTGHGIAASASIHLTKPQTTLESLSKPLR